MKFIKSAILIIFLLVAVQVQAWCADRYYVGGGSGLYNNVNNWSDSSGGSSGSSVPSTSDNIIIDPNSPATLSLDVSPSIVNLTITGTSTIRKWIKSSVTGTVRTITTSGTVTLSYCDWQDITGGATGGWATGTSIGNCGGNTGITFTTPVTRYWVGNGGSYSDPNHWASSSGGAGGQTVPLCHDTIYFDANSIISASQTITADMPRIGKDISFTGVANNPLVTSSFTNYIFGNLTMITNMTCTVGGLSFEGRDNCTFIPCPIIPSSVIYFNTYGKTIALGNSFTFSGANIYLTSGTFDDNGKTVTMSSTSSEFQFNGTITRCLNLSGNWNWTGNYGGNWFVYGTPTTNLSSNLVNSTIANSSTNAGIKYFDGAGLTWGNLKFTGKSGAMVISGSNTFNQLESDTTAGANIISLTTGTTQILTKLFANTEAGKRLTLQSTTSTPAVLTANTRDQFIRYCDPNYITFNGTKNWYADPNTCTITNCTGISTTRNFSTFNTAKNTFNETNNQFGGNMTSKY